MKQLLALLAALGCASLPALAAQGGISGHVVRESNGHAIVGAPVFIYKMPIRQGDDPVASMRTDGRGFFSDISLPLGRYMIATRIGTQIVGCTVDDVYDGFMTRMKVAIADRDSQCSGPHVRTALVNPALTADVYYISGSP